MRTTVLLTSVLLHSVPAGTAHPVRPLAAEESLTLTRRLTPLPKSVRVRGTVSVPAGEIRVPLPGAPSALDEASLAELAAVLGVDPGTIVTDSPSSEGGRTFLIDLRRAASDRDLIGTPTNADQAYGIEPVSAADGAGVRGIRCAALTDRGTYYAVKTLKQLLAGATAEGTATGTCVVPICEVRDWPDMAERGQWGGSCTTDIEWLSDLKFNLIEVHAKTRVDDAGVPTANIDLELLARAARHGVRVVPIVHHLEQLARSGLFKAYPNLRGKGAENSICFAQPQIVTVLSQWLRQLGETPGVDQAMIWLSEEGKGCTCEDCARDDRFVNEVRVCVGAWRKARESCPGLGLRLLLTQASYKSNDRILAATPPEVRISYYHGGLTYNTSRRPMIYPLLEDYAREAKWLGVYPTVSASWRIVAPFTHPGFVHSRMNEFVDKGLTCLVTYCVPANVYYRANVEAAMEWSWNAKGRTPREFAISYAVRRGLDPPKVFADWCEAIGPVSWDIYGSGFPYREVYGGTDGIIRGRAGFGSGIFAEFADEEQLSRDATAGAEALELARVLGHEEYLVETRIVQAYLQLLTAVWELSKLVEKDHVTEANRVKAGKWFGAFDESCTAIVSLYPQWSAAAAPELRGRENSRFWDTPNTIDRLAARVASLMEQCGFEDPHKPYRLHTIGTWTTEEFAEKKNQTRRLDVSEVVRGAGVYQFQPKYRKGTLGLTAHKVQLVSFPKDRPEELRVEAEDIHQCHAGAWVKDDLYRLPLSRFDPTRGYAVVAGIQGGQTTHGEFRFRKLRE